MYQCTVVNKYKTTVWDVDVQRGTKWGNYCRAETRELSILAFSQDFISKVKSGEITRDELEELRGKTLACTCKPHMCHADIIAHVVNNLDRFYE